MCLRAHLRDVHVFACARGPLCFTVESFNTETLVGDAEKSRINRRRKRNNSNESLLRRGRGLLRRGRGLTRPPLTPLWSTLVVLFGSFGTVGTIFTNQNVKYETPSLTTHQSDQWTPLCWFGGFRVLSV